jgi:hypothetical protein
VCRKILTATSRLEIRHRLLTARHIASILRVLRHARRDRPEPRRVPAGRVRPQDAADVPLAVEHVVVIVRPCAARAGFGGAFESEHVPA